MSAWTADELDRIAAPAGNAEHDVAVADADAAVLEAVDAAYRDKYGDRYASIVEDINNPEKRATTLRLTPR